MAWSSTSLFGKVALVLTLLGVLVFVVGFATPDWQVVKGYVKTGLWQGCDLRSGRCVTLKVRADQDWFKAVQAMECLGLIFAVLTTVVVVLIVFVESIAGNRNAAYASVAFAFMAALCIMIGVAVFGDKVGKDYLGYSFALACVACIIFVVDAVMCALNAKRSM